MEKNPGQILPEPFSPLGSEEGFSLLSIFHLKVDIQLNTMKPHSPEQ